MGGPRPGEPGQHLPWAFTALCLSRGGSELATRNCQASPRRPRGKGPVALLARPLLCF